MDTSKSPRKSAFRQWVVGIVGNRVVRAGTAAGTIKGAGLVTAFFLQMLLARIVASPTEYGTYAWGQNLLFLLGSLFALGIPMATSRLAAVHAGRGDRASLDEVGASGARWLALAALTGATVFALAILLLPAASFGELPRHVALLAVAASPLVAFTLFNQAMARAQSRLVSAFLPTQVLRPLMAGLLTLAWFFWIGRSPTAIEVLAAVAASLILVLGIQLVGARLIRAVAGDKATERTAPASSTETYGANRIMSNALPIFGMRLSDLFIQYGNVLVLGMLGGPLAAAGFFVAERLSQLASVPRSVISSVVQPWLASAHAEGEKTRLQQVLTHAAHTSLWPTLAIAAVVMALGDFLLGLFGVEYRQALPVLAILLVSHALGAALGPAQQVLVMSGQQRSVMRVTALAAIGHLIVLFSLIAWLGAVGAAVATLLSTTVARIGCLRLVRSRLQLEPAIFRRPRHAPSTENWDDDAP